MSTIYSTGIAIPVFIAVGVAVILAILLILIAKLCTRNGRWKAPPTPPTPRLTQFDMPEEEESCRLTLSRDGSPFVAGGGGPNMNICHGCTGCQGSCHQCSGGFPNHSLLEGKLTQYDGNISSRRQIGSVPREISSYSTSRQIESGNDTSTATVQVN